MSRFQRGKVYRFESGNAKLWKCKQAITKDGFKTINLSFERETKGKGVSLFLFRSERGRWRESFTPCQLDDYRIERVA